MRPANFEAQSPSTDGNEKLTYKVAFVREERGSGARLRASDSLVE